MAAKIKNFKLFGVEYKTTQFPAIPALAMMENMDSIHPTDHLRLTHVRASGEWVSLDSSEAINTHVKDLMFVLPPMMALRAVMKVVTEFNFGFVNGWKGVKIPSRFTSGTEARTSRHVDPLIAQLIQEDVASMRELEEYYSLEDAFGMFDVMVAKGVNTALANEAATKNTKR